MHQEAHVIDVPSSYHRPVARRRHLRSARGQLPRTWLASGATAILTGVYALHNVGSWVPWIAVIALTAAAMLCAIGALNARRLDLQIRRLPVAWALLGAAFLTLFLFSEFSWPVLFISVGCLGILYSSIWRLADWPAHHAVRVVPNPEISAGAIATSAASAALPFSRCLPGSGANLTADLTSHVSPWIDKLMRFSLRPGSQRTGRHRAVATPAERGSASARRRLRAPLARTKLAATAHVSTGVSADPVRQGT